MFFRNDNPGPVGEDDVQLMHEALRLFESQTEVRFSADARILAPILNTLTQLKRKFYLIHLPDGGGWVIRRHRPTGEHYGTRQPTAAGLQPNLAPGPRPDPEEEDAGGGARRVQPSSEDRVTAEEYFGHRDPDGAGYATARPSAPGEHGDAGHAPRVSPSSAGDAGRVRSPGQYGWSDY